MSLTVVIPWQAGCRHREAALNWVLGRYRAKHPDWHVIVAETPPGPWVKATAVNPVVQAAPPGLVVVADADVWCHGLPLAIEAVHAGAPWAIPHRGVHRFTEAATRLVLAGREPFIDLEHSERAYLGVPGGGIIVADRDSLIAAPLDPRFVGWGQEDQSQAFALATLFGAPWRGKAPLFHLFHPAAERLTRKRGNREGWHLFQRYLNARHDPAAMTALLEEARADLHLAQPAVPADPA